MEKENMRELTSKQRVSLRLMEGSIRQLEQGTTAEQHTSALLRLAMDAIERGYEAQLVALARGWRREVEAGSQP
jgi:hypothetical protein